ncbi:MAG: phenylalanine--tRNA ligase subunit alpha, partial [Lachnospiraceae bacterium]|nr:phenylalanine--tRNA ligase subunit alpha [Lachnospiraceae bacterium]
MEIDMMNANLEQIKQEIISGADELNSSKEVYEFRKKYLDGKTGKIGLLMKEMKNIPADQKAEYGKGVNELKVWALEFVGGLDEKMKAKELQNRYESEKIDISLPAVETKQGNLHPITLVRNQLIDVFSGMGFEIFEGTEIETDYYNFTALNTPQDHPARD